MDKSEYTLAERDCEHCKNYKNTDDSHGCSKWDYEFEPEEETCEKNARS